MLGFLIGEAVRDLRRAGRVAVSAIVLITLSLAALGGFWLLSLNLERAIATSPIPPRHLAGLLRLIDDGTISGKIAKDVFEKMVRSGEDGPTIVRREGLTQVADAAAVGAVIDRVLSENPKAIEDYKRGKTAAAKALVGQVMKATGGRANPGVVNRLLEEKLSKI